MRGRGEERSAPGGRALWTRSIMHLSAGVVPLSHRRAIAPAPRSSHSVLRPCPVASSCARGWGGCVSSIRSSSSVSGVLYLAVCAVCDARFILSYRRLSIADGVLFVLRCPARAHRSLIVVGETPRSILGSILHLRPLGEVYLAGTSYYVTYADVNEAS